MDNFNDIELCEPVPFLFGDNGHLGVTDGTAFWIIIVTREAMLATAKPPEASLNRLVRYADLYRQMAEAAIGRREDQDGKVWIFERDILSQRTSLVGSRPRARLSQTGVNSRL